MFKNFPGYNLVAKRQDDKKQKKEAENKTLAKAIKIIAVTLISLIVWCLPSDAFGIPDLTLTEQRTIAIFIFASLMWLTEGIPSWATSTLVIVILLYTCSDSSLNFFVKDLVDAPAGSGSFWDTIWPYEFQDKDANVLGALISHKKLMACFADPIIMLFIGGFILAIAATKVGLDVKMAKIMLAPFGTKSENVLLGFLLVTGVFSMFLSNTATAAMMLTFLTPVLKQLPPEGKGRVGLALAIPIGANIGGIGTPIGTPPNAIALKALNDAEGLNMGIGFGEWMMFMFPLAIFLLFVGWFILKLMFPFSQKTVELKIEGEKETTWQSYVVYITFIATILLWVLDKVSGVNSNVVGLLPVGVFCACGIITRKDLEEINWSVLWMVAGGFAIGLALQDTKLAAHLIETIPFDTWPAILMIVGSGILCYALSNFISNTATAALLIPILTVIGTASRENLEALGGVSPLLIGIALSASLAMVLPISTPPNALAHATGMIEQKQMMRVGLIMGVIGLVVGYAMLIVIGKAGLI
ncbi:MAG: SLC13/DASS family transporter [Prevotella sp.]|nr:SLC13/DASS family transporter [Prevotella sp.]